MLSSSLILSLIFYGLLNTTLQFGTQLRTRSLVLGAYVEESLWVLSYFRLLFGPL